MARELDPYRLSSPQVYLWRMGIFLVLAGFVATFLHPQIRNAFMANPGLNGLIIGVFAVGVLMALRQVIRLYPEIAWVNGFRLGDPGISVRQPPPLIGPMATLLGDRGSQGGISPEIMRSILDSIGTRLDETRDLLRYLTGLLIFLGLLGTFWGLQETVGSVGRIIQSLQVGGSDVGIMFEDLKAGLAAPLGGMGTAFSSSLFGLAGSLVLGFLDLQGNQAQNRFYIELEDWLSTLAEPVTETAAAIPSVISVDTSDFKAQIDRLVRGLADGGGGGSAALASAQNRTATAAMADLAEGIQGLVQHMRSEQQMVREWVEAQAERQRDIQRLLEILAREHDRPSEPRELRISR